MEEFVRKNPWLGLESYKEGEILYGRDDDIRDLSQCVLNDIDTLLYGKSGIGKSSILNAGILPAARRSGYLPVLIRLSHKEKHSYLYQINQAIFNAILHSPTSGLGTDVYITNGDQTLNETQSLIREVVPCKDTEAESFYEYFHRHTFHNANGDRLKLLIIFDQFEEIFTLQDDVQKKKNFFTHLADLLNDIMPDELQQKVEISSDTQEEIIVGEESNFENIFDDLNLGIENSLPEYVTDNDIHFVFTIREDFLSEFEYYSAAIPSLKQNRYGLRPINEEQAAQIILRPVPELIDESVAKLIIEKITGKNDFKIDGVPEIEVDSAVLSLYLNRLYEAKGGNTITRDLVEQKGGEIISDFYNDALSDISDSTIEYLEDMLLNGQGRRDNITVYDAINDGNISEQELDILCNKKKILRQFNYASDLRIEYIHDILCPVVKERKEQRELILAQELERKRQEKEKQELLQERERERTIRNIEYNNKKRATERNVLIHKGRRLIDNALDFGELRTLSGISSQTDVDRFINISRLMSNAYEVYFEEATDSEFVNQQVFSDPLLNNSICALSFYKEDESTPTIDGIYGVELRYNGTLISDIFFKGKMVAPDGSMSFDEPIFILGGYCGIHIDYDENKREIQRIYLDDSGNPITTSDGYSVIQTKYDEKDNPVKIRYYILRDGDLLPIRHLHGNHGYDSVFDKNGNEIERHFVDENEQPTSIVSGVYGKRITYDIDSFHMVTISNIDTNGELMADKDGYVTEQIIYDKNGLPTINLSLDENGRPWRRPDGTYGNIDNIDYSQNIIETYYVDENGTYIENNDGAYKSVIKVNEKRQITELYSKDKNDQIIESEDNQAIQVWSFDEQNRLQSIKFLDKDRLFISGLRFDCNREGTHITRAFCLSENGIGVYEDYGVEGIEYSLNEGNNLPVFQTFINEYKQFKTCNDGYYAVRKWEDDKGRIIKELYYDVDGTPMPDNSGIFGIKLDYLDEETTKRIYLDADENIIENKNGVAYTVETRNSSGFFQINYNIKEEPYENDGWVYINQERIKTNYGFQERLFVLNSNKEQVQMLRPRRANADWGWVPCIYDETNFDEKGRPISQYFKDFNGNIVGDADGNSYTIWEYDDSINQEILSLYNINDELRVRIKTIKDYKNRITEQSFVNIDNEYIEHERGYSGELYEYDDEQNTKTITYIDANGNICNNKDGFAHRISWYDSIGRLIAQKDVTIDDKVHGLIGFREFIDSEKRECAYYIHREDEQGHTIPNENGSVYNYIEEDNKGRTIKQLYLDADKLPVMDNDGDYGLSYEYCDDKNLTILTCLDESSQPHNNKSGYGIIHIYRDGEGHETKRMHYTAEGLPATFSELLGCYGLSYEYPNEHNKIVGYLNEDGEITTNIHGYAYREECFNPETGVNRKFYYDKDRNNTQSLEDENKVYGYAIYFDNNWKRIISLGKDGAISNNACGYAIKHELYEDGKLRFYKFLDIDNRPIADSVGDYGTEILHSDDGSMVRLVSLNEKYDRHLNDYGYCFCDIITDMTGEQFRIWRDMENNQVLPKLRFVKLLKKWLTKFKKQGNKTTTFNPRQIGAIFDCVLGNIEGYGHGKKQGLRNTYVILQYDEWCFGDELEKLGELIANTAKQSKHLVLLPVVLNGSLLEDIGDIMEFNFPAGQIGLRFREWGINIDTLRIILDKKKEWDDSDLNN